MATPAGAGGNELVIGESPIFEAVAARRDAPIAEGTFSPMLVSHGGMSSAPHQASWIASRLAARGYVIAVVRPSQLGTKDAGEAVGEL